MPTQIPVEPEGSWTAAVKAALLHMLLAAVIISGIAFTVIWVYA